MNHKTILTTAIIAISAVAPSASFGAEDKVLVSKKELQKLIDEGVEKALKSNKYGKVISKGKKVVESGKGTFIAQHDYIQSENQTINGEKVDWKDAKLLLDRPLVTDVAGFALGNTEQAPEMHSIRDMASSVISGVNSKGNLQSGWAASLNLGYAWDELTGQKHSKDLNDNMDFGGFFHRQLHRTNFSIASVKVEKEDTVNIALGLSTTLYQHFDETLGASGSRDEGAREPERVRTMLGLDKNASTGEVTRELSRFRSRSGVQAGIAPIFSSTTGKFGDLQYDGYTAYVGTSWVAERDEFLPFLGKSDVGNQFVLTLVGRYDADRDWSVPAVAAAAGKPGTPARSGEQDTLTAAGRISYGNPRGSFGVEGAYIMAMDGPKGDENAWQVSGNLNYRVYRDIYFVLNVGEKLGGDGEFFSIGGFQIGASEKVEKVK